MFVYLTNIFLITIYAIVFLYQKEVSEESKKVFVILATVQWILLSGLRHSSIGADTYRYKEYFEASINTSWKEAFQEFKDIIFYGKEGKDPGYLIFEKICGIFTNNYQVYLIIIATIFCVPMGISIYRNSEDPYISFLLYACLFYSFFSITGQRQTIATSLAVFCGYELVKKRKLIAFLIIILIASTIHKSAIIFLIFYPLYKIKFTKTVGVISSISILIAFVFYQQLSKFFKELSGYNYGIFQGKTSVTFILLLTILWIIMILFRKQLTDNVDNSKNVSNHMIATTIATFFSPLLLVNPSAMRVVQYFSLFLMYLIPDVMNIFDEREKRIVKMLFCVVLLFLFCRNKVTYVFFWQYRI